MTTRPTGRGPAVLTAEIQIPFEFRVIDGRDPSRCSSTHKAFTKSINLSGLVFRSPKMTVDSLHLSFADAAYGRNVLEIVLSLGGRFERVQLLGQVEWYEKHSTAHEDSFMVGIGFVDMQADAGATLRDFLHSIKADSRQLRK
ncbi:MAG: hypothetical protein AB1646_02640 [Thermodesulfobacteriota bacterium]